jgi:sarcosine oxidase subunit gamma
MPDIASRPWLPRSAWAGILAPGLSGRADAESSLTITPREDLGLLTVIGRRQPEEAFVELFGVAPPRMPRVANGRGVAIVWSGPGQWLLVFPRQDMVDEASRRLSGCAALAEQSDARAILRLRGPRARDTLAKGCPVDLHSRVFATDQVALTTIAHVGALLWQVDATPTYDIAVPRSMASSFWSWLKISAAEFVI